MDFFNEIWQPITRNRSRSILTGFGVFWGMMMLIVLVWIGQAMVRFSQNQVAGFATNSCFVGADLTSKPYKGLRKGREWQMRNSDIPYLEKEVTGASSLTYIRFIGSWEKNTHRREYVGTYNLIGVTPTFQDAVYTPILYGRFINEIDIAQQRKVCVVGKQVYDEMFPEGGDVTGQLLTVGGIQYRVVGVHKSGNSNIGLGGPVDEQIKLPLSVAQQTYAWNGSDIIHMTMAVAKPGVAAAAVQKQIKDVFRARHTIAPDDERAFWGQDMEDAFKAFSLLEVGLMVLVWFIGIGTLISGAVGVSNIMLVTVRERTKEIGIRRALGASPATIVRQILTESICLTALSGILGIILGVGLLQAVSPLLANIEVIDAATPVSFSVALGGLIILVVIGLFSGLLPAKRALAIKPIEALNEE